MKYRITLNSSGFRVCFLKISVIVLLIAVLPESVFPLASDAEPREEMRPIAFPSEKGRIVKHLYKKGVETGNYINKEMSCSFPLPSLEKRFE